MTEISNSVGEDLRAAYKASLGDSDAALDAAPETEAVDTPDTDAAVDDAPDTGQPRDDHGRFASKTPAQNEAADGAADTDGPPAEPEAMDPPADWKVDEQEMFRGLDPKAQAFVLGRYKDMQADYTKKTETVAQQQKRLDRLEQVLGPRRDEIARRGLDEATAVNQLFALAEWAEKNPADYMKWFAQATKVDLAQFGAAPTSDDDDDDAYTDPTVAALKQQVSDLTRQIGEIGGGIQQSQAQRSEAEQAHRMAQATQQLEAFATAADEKGQPKHPYFDQVMQDMIGMVQVEKSRDPNAAIDLEAMYRKAVWANDETRAKQLAAEKSASDREAERVRREKARAAQQAGSSVTGSPAGSTAPRAEGSVRELLESAHRRIAGQRI